MIILTQYSHKAALLHTCAHVYVQTQLRVNMDTCTSACVAYTHTLFTHIHTYIYTRANTHTFPTHMHRFDTCTHSLYTHLHTHTHNYTSYMHTL